jgi:ComF family protein
MALRLSISRFLDQLLPCACLLCGGRAGARAVCAACANDLPHLTQPHCPICATPLANPAPACGACLAKPPAFDATFAVWRYGFPLDTLVQMLKFRRRLASADFLAAAMLAGPRPAGDVIVPVPLSRERLRERGFNQAVEIARPLARTLRLPLDTTRLVRVQDAVPQSRLPWRARQGNVRNAFACRDDFSGKAVIVVDDVMTTGATLDAVARTLKDHGAVRVTNWVAARAVKGIT